MKSLKRPFIKIETKDGTAYGGNQAWFPYRFLRNTGCGVISATDLILHLQGKESCSEKEYLDFAKKLWMGYLPVIPGFGMNGLTLMIGLNAYFKRYQMPYFACWKISARKMLVRIDRMLSDDCPVILAVGPNFPKIWGKEKLSFYKKNEAGDLIPATKIKAHYVIVTGRDGIYLQISSWGKEYYIDIREYKEYVKQYSFAAISNIIDIKKI